MSGTTTEIHFFGKKNTPYIMDLKSYSYDASVNIGCIHFNGYYYVNDENQSEDENHFDVSLPQTMPIAVMVNSSEPVVEISPRGGTIYKYERLEEHLYLVEFYERREVQDTSQISEIDDDEGGTMSVCFFPTKEQKLYFKILKEFKELNEIGEYNVNVDLERA
jgi:hypothetical protein